MEDNVFSMPTSSYGYYRGWPIFGGDGSGMGVEMAGANVFSAGQGTQTGSGAAWSPTILYLFLLVIAEMFVFAFIARRV